MKVVCLALALLLAVGSQAASLQADAPADAHSMLAHARSVMNMYLDQVKDSTIKALQNIDDAEMKQRLLEHVESAHQRIKATQGAVSPVTDTIVEGVMSATTDFRNKITADVQALEAELVPLRDNLKAVVNKHMEQYRIAFGPIMDEYVSRHTAEMDALKAKMAPVIEDMRGKVQVNVEETKQALIPILEAVRGKVSGWLEGAKAIVDPYIQEYREKMRETVAQVRSVTSEDMAALNQRITPLAQEVSIKIRAIMEDIVSTVMKV